MGRTLTLIKSCVGEMFYIYKKKVKLDRNLSSLLRIDQRLQEKNLISQFTSCNTYLVHCVPLDKDETYIMGNPQAFMVALTLSRASLKR